MFLTLEEAAWVPASPGHTVKIYRWPPVGQSPQVVMRRVRLRVELKTESAKELIRRNRDTTVAEVLGAYQKSSRLTLAVLRLTGLASYENPVSSPIEAFSEFEP